MLRKLLIGVLLAGAVAVLAVGGYVVYAVQSLPSVESLKSYRPPVTTRVHAGDGGLIAEFATEQRIFVPIEDIPETLKQAFLSAEDKSFYDHGGIDPWGLVRGAIINPLTGKRQTGGSTITQQVAKNMLLSSDRKLVRKIREAFLAKRIESALDKNTILELYMNQVWLGQRAYGVAAAALNYFDKPLDRLTIAESAYLAALLKGPDNYHPVRRKERAIARRNWVIGQMEKNGFITEAQSKSAQAEDLVSVDRLSGERYVAAAHFVEELRRRALTLPGLRGEKQLYEGGLSIRTTMNTDLQVAAGRALRSGLEAYDRRHGWRGPVAAIDLGGDVAAQLQEAPRAPPISGWQRAAVIKADAKGVLVRTIPGEERLLRAEDVKWAAAGAKRNAKRALSAGAVVYVAEEGKRFALRQVPEVEGALVAMDPHTGRVLAMVGGYSFAESKFNRATQARRQPGSTFKPIVYAAALDNGFTPSTIIDDAPLDNFIAGDGKVWTPQNYTKQFYGPSTLRFGLEKSLNLMTIRVGFQLGPELVLDYGHRLGLYAQDPKLAVPSIAVGSQETTLAQMVAAYGMFVNGGKWIQPQLIDRIQDRDGKTIYRGDQRVCTGCDGAFAGEAPPRPPEDRNQVLDPITSYQIVSMLEGVVQRGTGTVVKTVGKPLAGKTGTTDDYKDAWFVGFSPDLVAGVWIGFDRPRSLGNGETGGTLAAPVFRDFMAAALEGQAVGPFRIPPGVRLVRVDAKTGQLPSLSSVETLIEAFRPGTEPTSELAASPFQFGPSGEGIDLRELAKLFPGEELEGQPGGAQQPSAPATPQSDPGLGTDDVY